MGFFDNKQLPGQVAIKQQKQVLHTEVRKDKASAKPVAVRPSVERPTKSHSKSRAPPKPAPKAKTTEPQGPQAKTPQQKLQQARKRKSNSNTPQPRQYWGSDSDGNESDDFLDKPRKRTKISPEAELDLNRKIRSSTAFDDERGGEFPIVHAADVANVGPSKAYTLAFPDFPDLKDLVLQYPSAAQQERYALVIPRHHEDFKALEDIREVLEIVAQYYLPPKIGDDITDDSQGLIRQLKRAIKKFDGKEYSDLIQTWNMKLNNLRKETVIQKEISQWKSVDLRLCEFILMQTYARTVSLDVNGLKKYKNGEDNVYGELLPKFVSTILKQDTQLKSDQVFVDLGSGVGNVVLQAALEIGCESWGCEMMPNACKLASQQRTEFEARCRLWGLTTGNITLEQGDFLTNKVIAKVLAKADVILVNNQAFTPTLNESLTNLFLDLKDGAKVVSLRSFAPVGHKHARNAGAIHNILEVTEKTYYSGCVSWTNASGTYYVATKDSSKMQQL